MKITKAVIPAAGLGTRFLPATKAQPKEMLPIIDKPTIQFVVEEAVASGIEDIIIITGRGKDSIEDHFDKSFELEEFLKKKGKLDLLKKVQDIHNMANIHYIRQSEPLGLGHAILCAERHIGNEPFAVLLGDDIYVSKVPHMKQLINVYNKYKTNVVSVKKTPIGLISRYGVIKAKKISKRVHLIEDMVEKPKPQEAPSDLAIMARYILMPEIFGCIKKTKPGVSNEIQLTDAMRLLSKKQKFYAYEYEGVRYDVGDQISYLKAIVEFALRRKDVGKEFKGYLKNLIKKL